MTDTFSAPDNCTVESLREADNILNPADFFPVSGLPPARAGLLTPAAGGHPAISQPFLLNIQMEGALLLISTRTGAVNFRPASDRRHPVPVRPQQAILIDCAQAFYLQSAILPWYGDVLLIGGNTAPYREVLFPAAETHSLAEGAAGFQELHAASADALQENRLLTDLLTDWANVYARKEKESSSPTALPAYLSALRQAVLCHPEEPFSLQAWENTLGVSRYRLCREYKATFGISPLQDVNRCRLNIARDRLLCTDQTVQEIAGVCGFPSPTQFINLFKRQYGVTPGEFRRSNQ